MPWPLDSKHQPSPTSRFWIEGMYLNARPAAIIDEFMDVSKSNAAPTKSKSSMLRSVNFGHINGGGASALKFPSQNGARTESFWVSVSSLKVNLRSLCEKDKMALEIWLEDRW